MEIKDCFKSRFDRGLLFEIDYSQLEVIGAAELSGDRNMRDDILNGIDSHAQSASWLNTQHTYKEILDGYSSGDPYFTKLRKEAKAPRFELQYGAGAKSIAANNNLSIEVAQGFIDSYYDRYRELKAFQDSVKETVESNSILTDKVTTPGEYPIHCGVYRNITGRGLYFEEELAPEWMRKRGEGTSYSPTKFKNYPIQSFATGDIVPEMLGRLMRYLLEKDLYGKVLPINTVHDSILLDVDYEAIWPGDIDNIKAVLEDVHSAMRDRFGITLTLPFKVDVECGESWSQMKKF